MKKKNLFLGLFLAVGLAVSGCGTDRNLDVTPVEQNRESTDTSGDMRADTPQKDHAENQPDLQKEEQTQTDKSNTAEITEPQAKEIAFQDAGIKETDVKGIRVEKDFDDGRHQYDVDFYAGNTEYDYEIDIYTGDILSRDYDIENDFEYGQKVQSTDYITKEEAIKIVLDRVKGATEKQVIIELDEEDGRLIYEGEVHYNDREYEFEMNASNGDMLEWVEEAAID